jgi:hypothetical protein
MGDLLGEDDALAAKDTLYRCLDKLLGHKDALFTFLTARWQDLFGVTYDVLLVRSDQHGPSRATRPSATRTNAATGTARIIGPIVCKW